MGFFVIGLFGMAIVLAVGIAAVIAWCNDIDNFK
jgi:hypothetical protein